MIYLGIDIGSSFIKAAAFDTDVCSAVLHTTFPASKKLPNPDQKKFELKADEQVAIVRNIIEDTMRRTGVIDGILLSTQMHGFVYRTSGTQDIYVSWQDSRCTNPMMGRNISYMEYLKNSIPPEKMESCGVYIKPSLGLCNLFAMLHSESPAAGDGELFTLGSYVISCLTGNNICHLSNAAPLGLVDLTTGTWNRELIVQLGFKKIKFPKIAESDFQVCGYFDVNGTKIPVYPDFGDQQTAVLGCMAAPEDIVINIATASQISLTTEQFLPGDYEIRPYFEKKYMNTISNMPGGRNLDVLVNFIRESVEKVCHEQVAAKQVWDAVLDGFLQNSMGLSADMGFHDTPYNVDGGSISHIKPENFGLAALFSAAFENMANCYRRNIGILTGETGPRGGLVFSGGVSWKNPPLLQMIGRETGLDYKLSSIPNEAFAGLFRIALVCSGVCNSLSDRPELTLKLS